MRNKFSSYWFILIIVLCIGVFGAGFLIYNLPPVHDRLAWRIDLYRSRIKYALNPPEEVVFIPQEQMGAVETIVETTLVAARSTLTPVASPTAGSPSNPTPTITPAGPTDTPQPTPTFTSSPTPLPPEVRLQGVKYEDQHNRWNYCGPANLSMALTFWGWNGDRDIVAEAIKPSDKDKNVMLYEMVDFVNGQAPGLRALLRYGGEVNVVKSLVAGGFPVVAEKGYYEYDYNGKLGWMGHYQFITGYDDASGGFIVQDTYRDGPDHQVSYTDFIEGWRSFNYIFLVVYPWDREQEVIDLLGFWADETWAKQHALDMAQTELEQLSGVQQFFAWFNLGTSRVYLLEYYDAAIAYDYAFGLYASLLEDDNRPFRMMWYQTGPYWAYYYSGRYQDVINLANTTLEDTISEPVLEESLYWRGLAKLALGDTDGAIADFRDSLEWHPGFAPSIYQLELLGMTP